MPPNENVSEEDWRNDDTVSDDEILWRVIHDGLYRPHPFLPEHFVASGSAYRKVELSVFIASQTTQDRVLNRWPPGDSLVAFTAGYVRNELGLIIVHDPKDTDPDPAHRLVGRNDHICMPKGIAKQLALKAEWVVFNHNPAVE